MKIVKEIISYGLIVLTVFMLRAFLFTPAIVSGHSMNPTLENNDVMLLNKIKGEIFRFNIVVVDRGDTKIVKRVIGLPGEHIKYEDDILYVNFIKTEETFSRETKTYDFRLEDLGHEVIPEGYYLVLGDNRNNSEDSRTIGLVSEDDIFGQTNLRIYPLRKFGVINGK